MSVDRGDCEHGHGNMVNELGAMVASDHGLSMRGAVMVVLPPAGEPTGKDRVFGRFNTAGLALALDAIFELGASHEPDGCATCDAAAVAMRDARMIFRDIYRRELERRHGDGR